MGGDDSCSGGGGRRAAAAAGWPPGPRGRVPVRRSGGVHGGATVASERGAREHGPEAAAAEAGEWQWRRRREPRGGCSCHEPRGRGGPRGRGAAGALRPGSPFSGTHLLLPLFPEFPCWPGAAAGGGGRSCHGTSWGLLPGGRAGRRRAAERRPCGALQLP